MKEMEALVAITHVPQLGPVKIRELVLYYGSAAAAWSCSGEMLKKTFSWGDKVAFEWDHVHHTGAWEEDLALADRHGVSIISSTHPLYPKRLLEIHDHPVILYIKGDIQTCKKQPIAVVGTRECSLYGREMAYKFGHDLAAKGFTVVSGLAKGIDAAAHEGALVQGKTLAVIGSGLLQIYPYEHCELAEKIIQNGALISEFPMKSPPDRQHFPRRNRIVSGISMGTFLVEAPFESGAMMTMQRAFEQKRKLYALPGRADAESFRGNHSLIKNGRAKLVEEASDIAGDFDNLFSFMGAFPSTGAFQFTDNKERNELPAAVK